MPSPFCEVMKQTVSHVNLYHLSKDNRECDICWKPYNQSNPYVPYASPQAEGPGRLSCGHVFGMFCLRQWLVVENRNTCPMCRAVVRDHEEATGNDSEVENGHHWGHEHDEQFEGTGDQERVEEEGEEEEERENDIDQEELGNEMGQEPGLEAADSDQERWVKNDLDSVFESDSNDDG